MSKTIVESALHNFRADLTDTPEGVEVLIWARDIRGGGAAMLSLKRVEIIDTPFHVALDRMHQIVQALEDGQWSTDWLIGRAPQ